MRMKKLIFYAVLPMCGYMGAIDISKFYLEHPGWYQRHAQIAERSNVSMAEALSIIEIESGFHPNASGGWFWGFFNKPKSSAKGYAQALDGAWSDYLQARGHRLSSRYDYMSSVEFVHWYIDKYANKFREHNPIEHYLLYYNGPGNYAKGHLSNHKKAEQVAKLALSFDQALKGCEANIQWQYAWSKFKF